MPKTDEELTEQAEKYARRDLTCGERDRIVDLMREQYIAGFKQGYSCAGGIITSHERRRLEESNP